MAAKDKGLGVKKAYAPRDDAHASSSLRCFPRKAETCKAKTWVSTFCKSPAQAISASINHMHDDWYAQWARTWTQIMNSKHPCIGIKPDF
jgi:hypothetical protein